jgi:hypothetical protein
MAIHPVPDNNPAYMTQSHGTAYLITDPRADVLLAKAHREHMAKLKERKTILDAWTI